MRFQSAALAAIWLMLGAVSFAAPPELPATIAAYLDAYAHGDRARVLSVVDPSVRIYGSDIAETYSGPDGVAKMLDGDMKLWRGSGSFGPMQDVSVAGDERVKGIVFNVPFTVGKNPPVMVRVSMLWRLERHGWKLLQSSNAVPTVGQSADDIVKGASKP